MTHATHEAVKLFYAYRTQSHIPTSNSTNARFYFHTYVWRRRVNFRESVLIRDFLRGSTEFRHPPCPTEAVKILCFHRKLFLYITPTYIRELDLVLRTGDRQFPQYFFEENISLTVFCFDSRHHGLCLFQIRLEWNMTRSREGFVVDFVRMFVLYGTFL